GPRDRSAPRGRGDHRDDLRVARCRTAHRASAAEPRLPRRAGGGLHGLRDLHADQSRRGSALRVARSPNAPRDRRITVRQLRRHALGVVGLVFASLAVIVALAAPWLAPHDPITSDFTASLKPPGTPGHPLGTDQLGRDLLSRVLYGARIALFIGFCTVL